MKSLSKKLAALGLAVLMLLTLTVLPAFAQVTQLTGDKTATVVGDDYYKTLESAAGTKLTGTPSLTMFKHVQGGSQDPIFGVEFKYAKVGDLYQIKDGATTVMAYGVSKTFAAAVGLTNATADYKDNDNLYFEDFTVIQTATRAASKDADPFKAYVDGLTSSLTTNDAGKTAEMASGYGLYLVVEYDVSNAEVHGEPIAITESQSPFIVALPTLGADKYWDEVIEASVKNSTGTADVQKKIVVGTDETKHDGTEDVADTDTTSIGDTVHYRHKATLPDIPSASPETITKFDLTDNISKGLTVDTDSFTVITNDGATRTPLDATTDYTVSTPSDYAGSDADYTGGQTFTVEFTATGLTKLTDLAKSTTATAKEVYVYYSATVNENAVVGPAAESATANSGNPNEVMLTYKVGNGSEIETTFDKVTHFTFEIDVTKQFEGDPGNDVSAVTFKLYSEDAPGTKTYYKFTGADGVYSMTDQTNSGLTADDELLHLSAAKTIAIKGLEEGTYYLEETATAGGYNLLKEPVEIKIDAVDNGTNAYVQDTENASGTGHTGQLTAASSTNGKISLTVVNTQGFTLPSTGGAGIWMFVIGGVAVIAAGCAYFVLSRKKQQG